MADWEAEQGNTRNESLTVGTTAVLVSQAKSVRVKEYVYRNSSTGGQTITLVLSNQQTAVAGAGVVLSAGQAITDTEYGGHYAWAGSITAISSAADAILSIYERS